MVSKRATIRRRLTTLCSVQAIYMPCVPQLLARALQSDSNGERQHTLLQQPEEQAILFPHQLSIEELERCTSGLAEIEERLRDAQLYDALDKLRLRLHIKTRLVTFKNRNVRHQGPNTRARRHIDVNETKIVQVAEKYRAARRAKLALAGHGPWEHEWRELAKADVRTMLADDDPINISASASNSASEGRRTTSWIWMAADRKGNVDDLQDGTSNSCNKFFLR